MLVLCAGIGPPGRMAHATAEGVGSGAGDQWVRLLTGAPGNGLLGLIPDCVCGIGNPADGRISNPPYKPVFGGCAGKVVHRLRALEQQMTPVTGLASIGFNAVRFPPSPRTVMRVPATLAPAGMRFPLW